MRYVCAACLLTNFLPFYLISSNFGSWQTTLSILGESWVEKSQTRILHIFLTIILALCKSLQYQQEFQELCYQCLRVQVQKDIHYHVIRWCVKKWIFLWHSPLLIVQHGLEVRLLLSNRYVGITFSSLI